MTSRNKIQMKVFRSHLLVCGGTGCHASGSLSVKKALVDELQDRGLADEIKVVETGCNGFCAMGPIMVVYPQGDWYAGISEEAIDEILRMAAWKKALDDWQARRR